MIFLHCSVNHVTPSSLPPSSPIDLASFLPFFLLHLVLPTPLPPSPTPIVSLYISASFWPLVTGVPRRPPITPRPPAPLESTQGGHHRLSKRLASLPPLPHYLPTSSFLRRIPPHTYTCAHPHCSPYIRSPSCIVINIHKYIRVRAGICNF